MTLPATPSYPVRVRRPVLWGDMDAIGHVNNTIYLRWFEEARIQYFMSEALGGGGGSPGIILAHQRCDYLAPVRYPDLVETRVSIVKIGTTSMTMAFTMSSEVLGREIARGEGVVVGFDYATNRAVPWSEEYRARVIAFER